MTRHRQLTNTVRGVILLALSLTATYCANAAEDQPEENLLANGDFEVIQTNEKMKEIPAYWMLMSSNDDFVTCIPRDDKTGEHALLIKFTGKPQDFQGLIQDVEVDRKERYDAEVYVKNNPDDRIKGGGTGQLVIEWRDADDKEIKRTWSKKWDRSLSRKSWRCYTINKFKPPPGAVKAVIGIHTFDGPMGSSGSFLIDDFSLKLH